MVSIAMIKRGLRKKLKKLEDILFELSDRYEYLNKEYRMIEKAWVYYQSKAEEAKGVIFLTNTEKEDIVQNYERLSICVLARKDRVQNQRGYFQYFYEMHTV